MDRCQNRPLPRFAGRRIAIMISYILVANLGSLLDVVAARLLIVVGSMKIIEHSPMGVLTIGRHSSLRYPIRHRDRCWRSRFHSCLGRGRNGVERWWSTALFPPTPTGHPARGPGM